jgi:actin-related protein
MPSSEDYQVKLGVDRYRGQECLFQPQIVGLDSESLSEIIEQIFYKVGPQKTEDLVRSVVLTGGNSKTQGFAARVQREI